MKKLTFASLLVVLFAACQESSKTPPPPQNPDLLPTSLIKNPRTAGATPENAAEDMPEMSFSDTVHNFGKMYAGEEVTHEFEFTNTGKAPLLISGTTTSCGCTVASYPTEPVLPGEKGKLKVNFKPNSDSGFEEKSVNVHANTARGMHNLYIKAEVVSKN